jgi:hypothetical protein
MDDVKKAISGISDDQWSELAKLMGSTAEEVKSKYELFLTDMEQHPEKLNQPGEVTVGRVDTTDGTKIPVGWCPIPFVLCLVFSVDWTGGDDWSLDFDLAVTVFGNEVWKTNAIHLSSSQSYVHLQPSIAGVFKLDVYIGVRETSTCRYSFYVQGQACYWAFSWRCSDEFNKDLYCFSSTLASQGGTASAT